MASTLIQFRIENDEKQRSSQILETMGLSLPAYLRICMIRNVYRWTTGHIYYCLSLEIIHTFSNERQINEACPNVILT